MPKFHTDRSYDQQLQELRQHLLLMAGRVEEMIEGSMRAFVNRDATLARKVIELDALVNRAEIENDELCLRILATRQPMASDLRFITLTLKMVTDLERIGDLAVNICERAIDLKNWGQLRPREDVQRMAALARSMVRDAIDAFVNTDPDKARGIFDRDDEVDELYVQVFRRTLAAMVADSSLVEPGIHVLSVAKWLERMADHAENLAEQVVFLIKGKDIRHPGKLDTSDTPL